MSKHADDNDLHRAQQLPRDPAGGLVVAKQVHNVNGTKPGQKAIKIPDYLRAAHHRFTIEELVEDPPPQRFVVHPYVPEGVAFVLAGPGSSNKTTLTTYLAVCRALGVPMWGRIPVSRGETAIISTEDRLMDYRRKLHALRLDMGDEYDAHAIHERVHFLDLCGEPVRMVHNDHGQYFPSTLADELAAFLEEVAPRADLVCMETVSRLAGGVEVNDSLSILVESAQKLSRLRGASVGLVHHSSQNAGQAGDTSQYAVRGGTALVDNARSVMVLQRVLRETLNVLAPDAEVSPHDLERLRVLAHPKANGAASAKPLLLEVASNRHGPVLHLAELRARTEAAKEARATAQLVALCSVVERLTAAGEDVTDRALRSHTDEIGCAEKKLPAVILQGLEAGALRRSDKTVRGGANPLLPVPGWEERLRSEPVQPEQSGADAKRATSLVSP